MILTLEEIEAIRVLVGPIEVDEAARNPNVFNERIEAAIGKILDHYEVTFAPVAINWQFGGMMQAHLILMPRPKIELPAG